MSCRRVSSIVLLALSLAACTDGPTKPSPATELCSRALGHTAKLATATTVGDVRTLSVGPAQNLHSDAFPGARSTDLAAWCWDGPHTRSDGGAEYTVMAVGPDGASVLIGYPGQIEPSGVPFFP